MGGIPVSGYLFDANAGLFQSWVGVKASDYRG